MKTMSPLTLVMVTAVLLIVNVSLRGAEQLDRIISMTGGNSTLTYNINTSMKGTGVSPSATGKIQATLRRKGTAINEQLRLSLAHLIPNTVYQLTAFIGDNTSATNLNGFTTDAKGAFTSTSKSNGGSSSPALLKALGVLSNVREIDIVNGSGQTVLQADMVDPNRLTCMLSRRMDNTGFLAAAAGAIRVMASQKSIRFQLQASGLTPKTAYLFQVNEQINQKFTSDKKGKLKFKLTIPAGGSPDTSLDVFDIRELTLTDGAGSNIVLRIGDILPTVVSTVPANGATDVAVNGTISATFSKPMNPSTINTTTFTVQQGTTPFSGTVTYAGATATFTLASNLPPNTTFTATITTGAQDVAGNGLANNFVWTFTTVFISNGIPPRVIATAPIDGATNVAINRKLTATFDKAMDPSTINPTTFIVKQGGTQISGAVTYAGTTAVFKPASNLAVSTLTLATITIGATDLVGNALTSNFNWSFTTGTTADTTPPTVLSTIPADNATNVAINQIINATFSKAMDPQTIVAANFTVTGPGTTPVTGTVAYDTNFNMGTFTPGSNLASNTLFTATVSTGVTDLAGNALAINKVWTFTTGTRLNQAPAPLGTVVTVGSFGGSGGGAGMTNSGVLTVVNGDIGTTGASTTVTGFDDSRGDIYTETPLNKGHVNGVIDTAPPAPGGTGAGGTAATFKVATQAASDALTAFNNLSPASRPGGTDPGAGELGGLTLFPGVYKSAGATFQITGSDLTLDGQGDVNAVWVFQTAAALTVGAAGAPRSVILINGAQAKNVFWQVGSAATINAAGGGTMVGTIIASAGLTFSTAGNVTIVTLNGRAIGLNASTTLVNTVINVPAP